MITVIYVFWGFSTNVAIMMRVPTAEADVLDSHAVGEVSIRTIRVGGI